MNPLKKWNVIPQFDTIVFHMVLVKFNAFNWSVWIATIDCHNEDHNFVGENICVIFNRKKKKIDFFNRNPKIWAIQQMT